MNNHFSTRVLLLAFLFIAQPTAAQELGGARLEQPSLLGEQSSAQEPAEPFQNVIDVGQKYHDATIVGIEVTGNKRVGADDIRANIGTRKGMTYNAARISRDIKAIYNLGFFNDVQVFLTEVEGGILLRFQLQEKRAISEVRVEGNDEVDEEDILEVIDLKENTPLDIPSVHKNVQKIKDLYVEQGFFLSEVTYRLEEAKGENNYDVVFVISEHAQVEVRKISFVGNHAISDAEINRYMTTRTGGPFSLLTDSGKFNRDMFDRDMTMIQALYWDRGYINIQVGTPRVELSVDRRYIFLSVPIVEGPRYKVGRINVVERDMDGAAIPLLGGRRKVRAMVRTQRDEYFSRTSIMEDVDRITRHYQDAGYAYANVELKTLTNEETRIVDLVLEVTRGPMVYFERIELNGNTKTRDRVIRRRLDIFEGDKYSQTGIDVSKARVTQLGFFETVDITTRPGNDKDKVIATVQVTEKHTGQFQVGMGFSTVENFIAQARITEQNFMGHGQTVSLQAQMSRMRQMFNFDFWEQHFLDTDWTFAFKMFNTTVGLTDYSKTSTGGELTLGHSLVLPDLRLYLSYNLQYDKINTGANDGLLIGGQRTSSGFNELPLAYLFQEGWSSGLSSRLVYDLRNNRLFPTKGSFNSVGVEWASEYLGSDFDYTRYTFNSKWYLPLMWKLVFRLNGNFGLIHSNDAQGLPISLRYRSGGIMDVRGYYPWSLGPKLSIPRTFNPNAEPIYGGISIGGNMRVTINAEIEFPIIEMAGIKGVVFFDAGNSFNLEDSWCQAGGGRGISKYTDPCNTNPLYLRTSVGFGLRWFSPMGPLRFEWGFPLKRFEGEESHQFEFTFGNFF
ncbi:MAG: outer membrane protein assembly factor BamA [Deltaproteobacteria bacterium]|nr:outer membrane protein assembly factor BamA [Deltaproteobacteria bacterium]MBN2670553.1 outer membrane protein assembly factor BamA [Deltaproteobacteria bacterium]